MTKTTRETERGHNIITLIFAVAISTIIMICFVGIALWLHAINEHKDSPSQTIDQQSYNEYIRMADTLNEKCGSTYLVQWEGEWTVFKNVCKDDGFCKYDYVKLSDCLK